MTDRKLAMEVTKKNYAEDKERFIALKNVAGAPLIPKTEVVPAELSDKSKTGI
jgi:hypothetical protein